LISLAIFVQFSLDPLARRVARNGVSFPAE